MALAVFLAAVGVSSQGQATPLACLHQMNDASSAARRISFAQRLADRIDFTQDHESRKKLWDRAGDARDQGWSPDRIRREEAWELANAALICAPHTANALDPEDTSEALRYLAALALHRHMTDPLASASARDTARRLLGVTDLLGLELTGAAAREVGEMRRAAEAVIGAALGGERPLRERVDSEMARMTSLGGSPLIDEYLKAIQEPVRLRMKVLVDIALTRESARSLTATGVARSCQTPDAAGSDQEKAAGSDQEKSDCMKLEEDLSSLSDGERNLLARMREAYLSIFLEDEIPAEARGASERLIRLRGILQKRGAGAEDLKEFCVTKTAQGGEAPCLVNEDGLLLSSSEPYASDDRITALVPLQLLDMELRNAAAFVLTPFARRFDDEQAQGIADFLGNLAGSPSDLSPGPLNEYQEGRMALRAFQVSGSLAIPDFCAPGAPSASTGPYFASGEEEAKQARATVEGFVSGQEAGGGDLAAFCGIFKTLVGQTSGD